MDWNPNLETTIETFVGLNDMCVTPGAVDAETAPWAVKRQILSTAEVKDTYPNLPDGALGQSFVTGYDWTSPLWRYLTSTGDLSEVLTLYVRPGAGRPGGVYVVVGDQFAEVLPWYYPWQDRQPLAFLKGRDDAESWFGIPPLIDAVPLQEQINEVMSYEVAALRLFGAPKLVVDARMKDSAEQAMRTLGGIIEIQPGVENPPAYLSPPAWHVTAERVLERQAVAVDDVQSMTEAQRGIAPANIESGIGVTTLLNSGRGAQLPMIQGKARFYGRLGGMVLHLHSVGVSRPRDWLVDARRAEDDQPLGFRNARWHHTGAGPRGSLSIRSSSRSWFRSSWRGSVKGSPATITRCSLTCSSWTRGSSSLSASTRMVRTLSGRTSAGSPRTPKSRCSPKRFEQSGRPRDRDALRMFVDQIVGSPATYDDHRKHIHAAPRRDGLRTVRLAAPDFAAGDGDACSCPRDVFAEGAGDAGCRGDGSPRRRRWWRWDRSGCRSDSVGRMSDVPPDPVADPNAVATDPGLPSGEPTRERLVKERDDARKEAQAQRQRRRDAEAQLADLSVFASLPAERREVAAAMVSQALEAPHIAAADARKWANMLDPQQSQPDPTPKEPPMSDTPPAAADPNIAAFGDVLSGLVAKGVTPEDFANFGETVAAAKKKQETDEFEAVVDKRADQKLAHRDRLADHQSLASYGIPTDTKEGAADADLIRNNIRAGVPQDQAIRMVADVRGWGTVIENIDKAFGAAAGVPEAKADTSGAVPEAAPPPAAAASAPTLPGPAIAPMGTFQMPQPDTSKPASAKPANREGMTPAERIKAAARDPKYGFDEATIKATERGVNKIGRNSGFDRPRPDEFETRDGDIIPV